MRFVQYVELAMQMERRYIAPLNGVDFQELESYVGCILRAIHHHLG